MEDKKEEKISTGVSIDDAFSNKPNNKTPQNVDENNITFKKIFLHSPMKYLISLGIMICVIIVFLSIKGFNYLVNYSNAFFIGGALFVGISLLSIVTNLGTFDIFSYSGRYVINRIKNVDVDRFPEYCDNKKEKRKKLKFEFAPYLVLGVFALLVAVIILIIVG